MKKSKVFWRTFSVLPRYILVIVIALVSVDYALQGLWMVGVFGILLLINLGHEITLKNLIDQQRRFIEALIMNKKTLEKFISYQNNKEKSKDVGEFWG